MKLRTGYSDNVLPVQRNWFSFTLGLLLVHAKMALLRQNFRQKGGMSKVVSTVTLLLK